jgi:hypothetical protein
MAALPPRLIESDLVRIMELGRITEGRVGLGVVCPWPSKSEARLSESESFPISMLWPRSCRPGELRAVEQVGAGAWGSGLRERRAELYTSSALGLGGVVWRLEKEAESLLTSLCPRL